MFSDCVIVYSFNRRNIHILIITEHYTVQIYQNKLSSYKESRFQENTMDKKSRKSLILSLKASFKKLRKKRVFLNILNLIIFTQFQDLYCQVGPVLSISTIYFDRRKNQFEAQISQTHYLKVNQNLLMTDWTFFQYFLPSNFVEKKKRTC